MKLLDRYLDAVRQSMFLTPTATRNDILRELAEEIRVQLEAKEEDLGRPLKDPEAHEILERFGHPLVVAGRYRGGSGTLSFGRPLVGPELFPLYRLILVVNLSLTAIVLTVIALRADSVEGLTGFVPHLALQAAIITGIFVAAEAGLRRAVRRGWSMRTTKGQEDQVRISRLGSILELIFTVIFANIWLELPMFSDELIVANGVHWTPGPVWNHFHGTFFLPILAVMIVSIVLSFVNLIDPYKRASKLWISALANFAFAGMIALTLSAHWATLTSQFAAIRSSEVLARIEKVAFGTNVGIAWFLGVFALVAVCQAMYEVWSAVQLRGAEHPRGNQSIHPEPR